MTERNFRKILLFSLSNAEILRAGKFSSKYIILNFPTLDLLVLNEDYKNVFDVAYPILYTLTLSRCCGT